MRFNENDKVKVILSEFVEIFKEKNKWIIDHIRTQVNKYPSLYICYNYYDNFRTLYFFTEEQVEKID